MWINVSINILSLTGQIMYYVFPYKYSVPDGTME
jgi:hypothetical protein